ncbi:transcriptional regulation of mitochondrial recombination-domain-containing protein, partial [Geopyxis carbonaria]
LFLYSNIQTKQVVYSFTRTLKVEALKQLPFLGKKSVPEAIRKDHWHPLATVTFPTTDLGLKTFHKLREFRKLHETKYPEEVVMTTSYKERKYKIMDQKANSIADLAESLRIELERNTAADVKEGDVVVSWADILDAEYAEKWPQKVK